MAGTLVVCALSVVAVPARADIEHRVCLVPLGDHDDSLIPTVIRGVSHVYGLDVEVLPAREMPAAAWYAPRRRHRADKVLAFLDAEVVPESGCTTVLGFTSQDISTTSRGHRDWGMMGLARIGGHSAIVSTHRLGRRADRRVLAMRTVKLANHELGHTFGLRHHDDCVMEDVRGQVSTVDRRSGLFCDHSRHALEQRGLALPVRQEITWREVIPDLDR